MRRVLLMLFSGIAALSCNTQGYTIDVNVTVPPEAQRVFSKSDPGFVMDRNQIVGVLCAPQNGPVILQLKQSQAYVSCEDNRHNQDEISGTAYALRPTGSELDRLDARTRSLLACGETGPVEDKEARLDVYLLDYYDNLMPERKVAVGSSKGECISSSRYEVNITLALK